MAPRSYRSSHHCTRCNVSWTTARNAPRATCPSCHVSPYAILSEVEVDVVETTRRPAIRRAKITVYADGRLKLDELPRRPLSWGQIVTCTARSGGRATLADVDGATYIVPDVLLSSAIAPEVVA